MSRNYEYPKDYDRYRQSDQSQRTLNSEINKKYYEVPYQNKTNQYSEWKTDNNKFDSYLNNNKYYDKYSSFQHKKEISTQGFPSYERNQITNSKQYEYSYKNGIENQTNLDLQQQRHLSRQTLTESKGMTKRKCGLFNVGNTCYMNSILQCIFNTPFFLEYFLKNKEPIMKSAKRRPLVISFIELIDKVDNCSKFVPQDPSNLKIVFGTINSQFNDRSQQDAQEFLRIFLEVLHNELTRTSSKTSAQFVQNSSSNTHQDLNIVAQEWQNYEKNKEDSIITDFFSSVILSTIICSAPCGAETVNFQSYMDLSLFLPSQNNIYSSYYQQQQQPVHLSELLDSFFSEETLNDSYYCDKCKQQKKVKQRCQIWKLPFILVIHLKRFQTIGRTQQKLSTPVRFPVSLDMHQYVDTRQKNAEQSKYALFGIINHSGTLSYGHYTAQCKNPFDNSWNEFNDSECRPINLDYYNYDNKGSSQPYILFYYQINGSPIDDN